MNQSDFDDIKAEFTEALESLEALQKHFLVVLKGTRSFRTTGAKAPLPASIAYMHPNEAQTMARAAEEVSRYLSSIMNNMAEIESLL